MGKNRKQNQKSSRRPPASSGGQQSGSDSPSQAPGKKKRAQPNSNSNQNSSPGSGPKPSSSAPPDPRDADVEALGRVAYEYPAPPKPKGKPPKVKAEPELGAKKAGDHTFNNPFDAAAKALGGISGQLVQDAQKRLAGLAEDWGVLRDQEGLRDYYSDRPEDLIDANSLGFGIFSNQLRLQLAAAQTPEAFDQARATVDRMFRYGIVDSESLEKATKANPKLVAGALGFLQVHREAVDEAINAVEEERLGNGEHVAELERLIIRAGNAIAAGKEPSEADILALRELRRVLGKDRMNTVFGNFQGTSNPTGKAYPRKVLTGLVAKMNLPSKPGASVDSSSSPDGAPPGLAPAPGLAPNTLNVLHNYNHYHLLMATADNQIVDLDVPSDGSCFVHAAAWGELLAVPWAQFNHANPNPDRATVRAWFAEQIADLEDTETGLMMTMRDQIADELNNNPAPYLALINETIGNMMDVARADNADPDLSVDEVSAEDVPSDDAPKKVSVPEDDVDLEADDAGDPANWHIEGGGDTFRDALRLFISQNLAQVLDYDTDLIALANDPGLHAAYIAAIRNDPRMWTGDAERAALDTIRQAAGGNPIQKFLPSQAPALDIDVSVDEARARPDSSDPLFSDVKGKRFDVPKYQYSKLKVTNPGFPLGDVRQTLNKHGWAFAKREQHILERADVPPPFDLHLSLTQKGLLNNNFINQVEFTLRLAEDDKGKDRKSSVRWWYWIKRDPESGTVRLEFDGNVGKGDDAAVKQRQTDENELAYLRTLSDTGVDVGAILTNTVRQLEDELSKVKLDAPPSGKKKR